MRGTTEKVAAGEGLSASAFLKTLQFSQEALAALARQGFVARKRRAGKRVVYRVCFRLHRRQVARCLGSDAALAEAVRSALHVLQAKRRAQLDVQSRLAEARALTRAVKSRLGPH